MQEKGLCGRQERWTGWGMIASEPPLWLSLKEVTTVCLHISFPREEVVDLVKGEAQAIFKELCAQETFCGGSQSSCNTGAWAVVYIFTNRMGSG